MNALQLPTTAAGTMPLVQISMDRSTALVVLDSPEMDTTVKVTKIIKPPNLLLHKNVKRVPFFFVASMTQYLIT